MSRFRPDPRAKESTSPTLIDAARNGDQQAWTAIASIYTGSIYDICRKRRVQPDDAAEIANVTLIRVFNWMRNGKSELESFRGLLHTIAKNLISDHFRKLSREPESGGELDKIAQTDSDSAANLEAEIENELLQKTLPLAADRFAPLTFKIAMQIMLEGRPYDVVAEENELSRSTVYAHVSRVKAFLRKEILKL